MPSRQARHARQDATGLHQGFGAPRRPREGNPEAILRLARGASARRESYTPSANGRPALAGAKAARNGRTPIMDHSKRQLAVRRPSQPPVLSQGFPVAITFREEPTIHVQVRRRRERRTNHWQRYLFRGVDELRRQQQAGDGEEDDAPPAPHALDKLI